MSIDDLLDRELYLLTADRVWDFRTRDNQTRHVARRSLLSDLLADLLLELRSACKTLGHNNKQHDANIRGAIVQCVVLANDDGIGNLVHRLHNFVDISCADTNTARLQCGIGTTVDHNTSVLGDLGEISMAPNVWKRVKVYIPYQVDQRLCPQTPRHD